MNRWIDIDFICVKVNRDDLYDNMIYQNLSCD